MASIEDDPDPPKWRNPKQPPYPFPQYYINGSPELWLRQVDRYLACFYPKVGEHAMFQILNTNLPPDLLELVKGVVLPLQNLDYYSTFKSKIIGNYYVRAHLREKEIGNLKPSAFLETLRKEAKELPLRCVMSVWLSKLPKCVRDALPLPIRANECSLKYMRTEADLLYKGAEHVHEQEEDNEKLDGEERCCKHCKGDSVVTLKVSCTEMCEAMAKINLKPNIEPTRTSDASTQTFLG